MSRIIIAVIVFVFPLVCAVPGAAQQLVKDLNPDVAEYGLHGSEFSSCGDMAIFLAQAGGTGNEP